MPKKLYRVMVQASERVGPVGLWVDLPNDEEELKRVFQWHYGYWPQEIKLLEIVEEIEKQNVFEHGDVNVQKEETPNPNRG